MNAKLKICLLNYTPIGNTARNVASFYYLQNVWFTAKCQFTKKVFKSPVFYSNSSALTQTSQLFWEFQIFQSQSDLLIQMINFDSQTKVQQIISSTQLAKVNNLTQQSQVFFYNKKQRIGALTIRIEKQKVLKKIHNRPEANQNETSGIFRTIQNKTIINRSGHSQDEDSENQRYEMELTPDQTINQSIVNLGKVQDASYIHIFKGVEESSIDLREPFSGDQSFQLSDGVQSRARIQSQKKPIKHSATLLKQSSSKNKEFLKQTKILQRKKSQNNAEYFFSNHKNQKQPSNLKNWLKKLQKFQKQKEKQTQQGLEYNCIVTQRYRQNQFNQEQKQPDITLNLQNINLNSTIDEPYCLKTFKIKVIDGKGKQMLSKSLLQGKFQLLNQNDQGNSRKMKLNNLITQIPPDQNIEVEIYLENLDDSQPEQIKISGILLKDRFIEMDQIPLFDRDQNLFASLSYKAKTIKNVSVQYLSPLNQLNDLEEQQKSIFHPSKDHQKITKSLIRQRKINKIQRKQVFIDELNRGNQPTTPNPNLRNNLSQNFYLDRINLSPNSQPKKRDDYIFQPSIQRSNTDEALCVNKLSKLGSEVDRQSKSSRSPSIKRIKADIIKINQELLKYTGNVSLPVSPQKHHQNRLRMKSTTLADLREQQSQDHEEDDYKGSKFQVHQKSERELALGIPLFSPKKSSLIKKLKTQPDQDRNIPTGLEETIHHRNDSGNFVIEINAITIVLYEHNKQEEENGKFLILKSEAGQMFITDTLFTNHMNLNWKNKLYQFTTSKIEIGIYEKAGFSSQSQSKLMGKVQVKLIDLMKAIKQNFHRTEIFANGKPIGIVILIYDIFMEKQLAMHIHQDRRNNSQMKLKNRTLKVTSLTNQTESDKYHIRGSEKSTIKVGRQSNRKRAKTLQFNKKSYHLPVIDRTSNHSRRRPYNYEGGKNITIGRAERFMQINMAQVVGEM